MANAINQPKKPIRTVRVDDELWNEARQLAAQRGDVLSDVIRAALQSYVSSPGPSAAAARAGSRHRGN